MPLSTFEATATITSEIEINKTPAELSAWVDVFISDWADPMPPGMTLLQQNNWKLNQAHRKLLNLGARDYKRLRIAQLRAAQANLDAQADAENI